MSITVKAEHRHNNKSRANYGSTQQKQHNNKQTQGQGISNR